MKYHTTAAYISGAICGAIWQPGFDNCGLPFRADLRAYGGFTDPGESFRSVLLSMLTRRGGDFQNPAFAEDTVIRIERRTKSVGGVYKVHVREIPVDKLPDCADLARPGCFTCDYIGE